MRSSLRFVFLLILLCIATTAALAKKSPASRKAAPHAGPSKVEAATGLQVFLDRANFAPGKIDGHYGDFTLKALSLYRQSRGEPASSAKPGTKPDLSGIDLASIEPVFISYTISNSDAQNVGPVPDTVPEKAKLKALPYRNLAEAVAEKFHCDIKFLDQLNPGKMKDLKPGAELKVPNVEPFDLGAVKNLKPGSEINAPVANEIGDEPEGADDAAKAGPVTASVKVDMKTSMLGVFESDKLVAAYPVTIGSVQTASPVGEWKVRGIAKLPTFRYDEEMLKHGERSANFHMLPPGPNNPAGVIWIALNKKGIGLHGTNEPEGVGRAASHGCIRLANWDIVRLAGRVKGGVAVSIH